MTATALTSEDIVTVGLRNGMKASVVSPLFKKKDPIDFEKTKKILGCDEVILTPETTPDTLDAVVVQTPDKKRIGYVWLHQASLIRSWMESRHEKCIYAKVIWLFTTAEVLIIRLKEPISFIPNKQDFMSVNDRWAFGLPRICESYTEQSLTRILHKIHLQLDNSQTWSKELQRMVDYLLELLPSDLSDQHYYDNLALLNMMLSSQDLEVRKQGELILAAFIRRGSDAQLENWLENWLPDFFKKVEEGCIVTHFYLFGYTLEKVEALLRKAPANLYHYYLYDLKHFAKQLYHASLPHSIYNRLLNLLAIRELMKGDFHLARELKENGFHEKVIEDINNEVLTEGKKIIIQLEGETNINLYSPGNIIGKTITYGK